MLVHKLQEKRHKGHIKHAKFKWGGGMPMKENEQETWKARRAVVPQLKEGGKVGWKHPSVSGPK